MERDRGRDVVESTGPEICVARFLGWFVFIT